MPTASDIQKLGTSRRSSEGLQHEGRPFRERLLDFAKEYETLQARYDQLVLSNQDLKVQLDLSSNQRALRVDSAVEERFTAEIAQLREQVARSESQGMQDQARALAEEVSRLQKGALEKEEELVKAEAATAEEARRAAEAKRQADLQAKSQEEMVHAAEERTQAAEARAERAEARLHDLSQELHKRKASEERLLQEQAEREKRQADEAAAARADAEEALAKAKAADAKAAEARARADAEMKAAEDERAQVQAQAEAKAAEARRIAEASARLEADAKANAEERQEVLDLVKKELRPNGSTQSELSVRERKATAARKSTRWTEDDPDSGDRREGIAHVLPNLGKLMSSDWHGSYEHSPIAKARLFVFYGAGSRGASFGAWQKIVKNVFPEIEMVVFEYPGHGAHKAELCSDVGQLEQEFTQQVIQYKDGFQNYFNCPFAVIGQSAGARFGLNMIRKLCGIGARPEKFYVVGRTPPLVPSEPLAAPRSTQEFLDWVGDTILTSSKEVFKTLLSDKHPGELQAEEQMWRADIAMNSSPVPQLPRRWLVGRTGKLIKRPESDLARRVRIERDPGSELYVTGEEERGKGGERWVKIDTTRDNVKPGWWLVHGGPAGLNEELLEPLDTNSEPVDEHSLFWKAPVPFQIHYSTGDSLAPNEDPTGQQRPLREWNRLTQSEPEFVEHEDLLHDELLMHRDVLEYICHDFARTCRLR